jgi:hypothetical protein
VWVSLHLSFLWNLFIFIIFCLSFFLFLFFVSQFPFKTSLCLFHSLFHTLLLPLLSYSFFDLYLVKFPIVVCLSFFLFLFFLFSLSSPLNSHFAYFILSYIPSFFRYSFFIYLFIYQAVQCFHIFLRPFNNYTIFFLQLLLLFQPSSTTPFSPISPPIPSSPKSLGLPRCLFPSGRHFVTSFHLYFISSSFYCFSLNSFTSLFYSSSLVSNPVCMWGKVRMVNNKQTQATHIKSTVDQYYRYAVVQDVLPAISASSDRPRNDIYVLAFRVCHQLNTRGI